MVARGDLWWADFGEPVGSEPGFRRPVVVVSSDRFNRSRIQTIIVSALTSNLRLADAPGNVELPAREGALTKPSVVNVSQTTVVDRRRLIDQIGRLDGATMRRIDEGLRLVLAL